MQVTLLPDTQEPPFGKTLVPLQLLFPVYWPAVPLTPETLPQAILDTPVRAAVAVSAFCSTELLAYGSEMVPLFGYWVPVIENQVGMLIAPPAKMPAVSNVPAPLKVIVPLDTIVQFGMVR